MRSYLEDLIRRMGVDELDKMKDGSIRDSSETISWKAFREAEKLKDPAYLPLLKEWIIGHGAKKYRDKRDHAYFIMGKLLAKKPVEEYIQFYIEQLTVEDNKYVLSAMLDRIVDFQVPDTISIQPVLDCAVHKQWSVRHSAIRALASANREESRKMLRYYITQTDEKKYSYEITYANAALGEIGTVDDIPILEQHIKSRRPDIRISAEFAIKSIGNSSGRRIPWI
ncbi:MAG: HEAT repeat domain-containing protein [Lachnospiraceae bacterium]|nr:HEAT repeat domain-containing protein [Lachnospiraceae bacterium]